MSRRTKPKGFTLLEMTMAMAITAITGLSVAGATVALSRAHQDTEGFYQSLQTARSAMMRIQRSIQGAKLVTACTGTTLVLWANDTNGNGTIDADEVLLLVFDTASRQSPDSQQVFPDAVKAALNVEVPLSTLTDAATVVAQIVPSTYAQTIVLASDASDFLPPPRPRRPWRREWAFACRWAAAATPSRSAARPPPRGRRPPRSPRSDGQYVLTAQ